MKKMVRISRMVLVVMCLFVFGMMAMAEESASAAAEGAAVSAPAVVDNVATSYKFIAIAIMMVGGSLAASWAVGKIGAAAMGAAVERPELLGKAIAFVGLGEGIALFGFLIALMLINK